MLVQWCMRQASLDGLDGARELWQELSSCCRQDEHAQALLGCPAVLGVYQPHVCLHQGSGISMLALWGGRWVTVAYRSTCS